MKLARSRLEDIRHRLAQLAWVAFDARHRAGEDSPEYRRALAELSTQQWLYRAAQGAAS